jgi:ATP-dependent RNA helicase
MIKSINNSGKSDRSATERIDVAEDMEITVSADIEIHSTFDAMGLKEDLLRGIYSYGNYFIYHLKI